MDVELEPTPRRTISQFELLADQFQAWRLRTAEVNQTPLFRTFLPISDGKAIAISMVGQSHNRDKSIYEIGKLTVLEHDPNTTAPKMLLEMKPMFDWLGNFVGFDGITRWESGQAKRDGATRRFEYAEYLQQVRSALSSHEKKDEGRLDHLRGPSHEVVYRCKARKKA